MAGKIMNLYSWLSTTLVLYAVGYIHIINAGEYCSYYKDNDIKPSAKWCSDICCRERSRRENTTCCISQVIDLTPSTTYTIFGYSWWRIILCTICLFLAISILIHYIKRLPFLKRFQHFNTTVTPAAAFTITKVNLDDGAMTQEENPPSYHNSLSSPSPPPPPPYTLVNPSIIKISE